MNEIKWTEEVNNFSFQEDLFLLKTVKSLGTKNWKSILISYNENFSTGKTLKELKNR